MKIVKLKDFIYESTDIDYEFTYTDNEDVYSKKFTKLKNTNDINIGDEFIIGCNGTKMELKDKQGNYLLFTVGSFRDNYIVPDLTYKVMPRTVDPDLCWKLKK